MQSNPARLAPLALLALLAACGEGATSSGSGKVATLHSAPPPVRPVAAPPGLEPVWNHARAQLVELFGPPRLDVREGQAVRLQFTGTACILDVYLYPPSNGGEPRANWVEARRGDGRDVDKAACLNALKLH